MAVQVIRTYGYAVLPKITAIETICLSTNLWERIKFFCWILPRVLWHGADMKTILKQKYIPSKLSAIKSKME